MSPPRPSRARRLTHAGIAAAVFVLSAPFIGQARSQLRTAFPGRFTTIVGGALALLLMAALASAAAGITTHRARRFGAIAASLTVATLFAYWHSTGRSEVDVVELFHFLEYGVLTFLLYRAWADQGDVSTVALPVLAGLLIGTCDEWFQWFIPVRVGELNDIFLNLVAIGCGLVFSVAVSPPSAFRRGLNAGSRQALGRAGAFTLAALAFFVTTVHLGYTIDDEEAGTFESRFSKTRLLTLNATKGQEWAVHPLPLTLKRLSREDQYMTEATLHVQARNELWDAKDYVGAWRENRILEKYYDPVLDAPSYVSKTGHRWPTEQRSYAATQISAAAMRPAAHPGQPYPYVLFKWPAVWFVGVTGAIAMAVLMLGEWTESRQSED